MIDRATWSQFSDWCGTEIWLSIVARQIIALPYIYCFIPCLTRQKWGLWKYWSLQSIQWYLYTKRVLVTFFPCYNLSSRAVKLSGGTNPMKIFRRKNSKAPTTNYDSISVSSVGVTPDNAVVNWRIWGLSTNLTFVLNCLSRFQAC